MPISINAIAAKADRNYKGHPSCITCKVDYLGEGTCGACLLVANLCADSIPLLHVAEAARCVIDPNRGYERKTAYYNLENALRVLDALRDA